MVTQLQLVQQSFLAEGFITDNINLGNRRGDPFLKTNFKSTRFRGSGVTTAWTCALYFPTL